MTKTREAKSVFGCPVGECGEDYFYASVGAHFPRHDHTAPVVERITITDDLPGMYGNMERVRVFGSGEVLLWEGPLHNLEGVHYV